MKPLTSCLWMNSQAQTEVFILLETISYSVAEPLSKLFSQSLLLSSFANTRKTANVVPIPLKWAASYFSLLRCLGKLFERIIFKHLYNIQHGRRLINKSQPSFLTRIISSLRSLTAYVNHQKKENTRVWFLAIYIESFWFYVA